MKWDLKNKNDFKNINYSFLFILLNYVILQNLKTLLLNLNFIRILLNFLILSISYLLHHLKQKLIFMIHSFTH